MSLLIRSLEFAAGKHRMQRRNDEEASPYINHPIALMKVLCIEAGVRHTTILSAAALHDTVEDKETTGQELELVFGSEIASIVSELTDDKSPPKGGWKRMQIEHAPHMSRLVKLADKICNLRDVADKSTGGQALEGLGLLMVTELGRPFCRCPELERPAQPEQARL